MNHTSLKHIYVSFFSFLFILMVSQGFLYAQKVQMSSMSSITPSEKYPEILEKEMPAFFPEKSAFNNSAYLTNVKVSRSPQQVLITSDDRFAFVRCWLGNTVELIDIKEGKVIKSFSIPSPCDMSISNDGRKLFVASWTNALQTYNSEIDQCAISVFSVPNSLLTVINIEKQEIESKITFEGTLDQIIKSSNNDVVYLRVSHNVLEFNLISSLIVKKWVIGVQMSNAQLDLKNNKLFINVMSDTLKVVDLKNGSLISTPYYKDVTHHAYPQYLGIDTLSNRIFLTGDTGLLVYNAITLQLITTIKSDFGLQSFVALPEKNIIYASGFGYTALELDYKTLAIRRTIQTCMFSMVYNPDNNKMYGLSKGIPSGFISSSSPFFLDITEYDTNSTKITQWNTTNSDYSCCFARSLSMTSDGKILVATNSPENTVSILKLSVPTYSSSSFDRASSVTVIPNPTTDVLNVSINDLLDSDYLVEIRNMNGALIKSESRRNNDCDFFLDISNCISGLYILTISSKEKCFQTKVIKK